MVKSRNKGAAGEREAAHAFTLATGVAAMRSAQRTGAYGDADLATSANVHMEIKRRASIAALQFIRQAERDATPGAIPCAMIREDGDTEWVLMVRLKNVIQFVDEIKRARAEPLL